MVQLSAVFLGFKNRVATTGVQFGKQSVYGGFDHGAGPARQPQARLGRGEKCAHKVPLALNDGGLSVIMTDMRHIIPSEIEIKMKSPTSDETSISPAQCRAARAMIEWTRDDLAAASETARSTLADFEANKRQPHPRTIIAIRTALEAAGVEFIPENGGGAGVRFRKSVP